MDKIQFIENNCRRKNIMEKFRVLLTCFPDTRSVDLISLLFGKALCILKGPLSPPLNSLKGPVVISLERDLDTHNVTLPFIISFRLFRSLMDSVVLVVLLLIYLAPVDLMLQVGFGSGFSCLISLFNLTNSLATSSLFLCERIRNIVQPVSSI